jgi:hypothetical protein
VEQIAQQLHFFPKREPRYFETTKHLQKTLVEKACEESDPDRYCNASLLFTTALLTNKRVIEWARACREIRCGQTRALTQDLFAAVTGGKLPFVSFVPFEK